MKIEIICTEPNELQLLQDNFGVENVEIIIPQHWSKDEYYNEIERDLKFEDLKEIKVRIPISKLYIEKDS